MARLLGPLLALLLLGVVAALRWQVHQRAQRLLEGEHQALAVVQTLDNASRTALVGGGPHPGLAAILHVAPGLTLLEEFTDGEFGYASDGVYVYGLALTRPEADDDEPPPHGYVLRAWPWQFGVTGDAEYHVNEAGELWQGQNEVGRSGVETGFPPPFPEPTLGLGQRRLRWWRREFPTHK